MRVLKSLDQIDEFRIHQHRDALCGWLFRHTQIITSRRSVCQKLIIFPQITILIVDMIIMMCDSQSSKRSKQMTKTAQKFNGMQIEAIIDRVVPLIAAPADHEFFRGVLHIRAEASKSSADFSAFVHKLLTAN